MDAHDDVRIVAPDALSHRSFHGAFHVHVREHFVGAGVGHVVDELPLMGMGAQMFVNFDQRVVRGRTVELHDVAEGVGGAGEQVLELLREAGRRGAMAAAGVGGEEEDFERARMVGRIGYAEGGGRR